MSNPLGSLAFALSLGVLAWWVEGLLRGRLPTSRYRAYLNTPEWATQVDRLRAKRRGRRCAACATWQTLECHHWTYRNLGFEHPWQLVMLCGRCHTQVHTLSGWLLRSRTGGLWLTTLLVCAAGRTVQAVAPAPRP